MFKHEHPYPPFIPDRAEKLIVGTIPPPRFSTGDLYAEDVDFCYGSKYGLLWPILERIYDFELDYENTSKSIEQRKQLLASNRIGICDMVESCTRDGMEASDLGMKNILLRNLPEVLVQHPSIERVLFMGGNSKNGPEYLFQKQLKELGLSIRLIRKESPRINELELPGRLIECISLISPSSAANRSIGGHPLYKEMKSLNPGYSTLDFRISQFAEYF
jgi:G:T/U-mismatch repair DNA glycosylase